MSGQLNPTPAPVFTPAATMSTLSTNYIGTFDFTNQYIPDLEEQEFARYGNRTVAGLLNRLGAESPFQSDLIKWEEQGRLHVHYSSVTIVYGGGNDTAVLTIGDAGVTAGVIRVGQAIVISSNTNNTIDRALVTAVAGLTVTVAYFTAAGGTVSAADTASVFVYGSEFKKGSDGMTQSLESTPGDIYEVSPVIIREKYEVPGSDMAQIGWIETVTEEGVQGYLWYLKSESETRIRYNDYLEMMMVEHREAEAGSGVAAITGQIGNKGTTGLFQAIEDRGNVWGAGNPTSLTDWETVIQRLDKQGAIQEYTLYNNRQFSFDVTAMLAAQSSGSWGGLSYGMFDNSEEMALKLDFKGFKHGNYEIYQTDWRYLNDPTLRGGIFGGAINGVMIPVGTMTVDDRMMGQKVTQPFLHVRYRQSAMESRKYKSWVLGSAGGAHTSATDEMELQFLSERCLITLGANNFMLFEN